MTKFLSSSPQSPHRDVSEPVKLHYRQYHPPLYGEGYNLWTSGTLVHFHRARSNHGKLGGGQFDELLAARCAKFGKHNLLNDHEDVVMQLQGGRTVRGMRELRHLFIDCATALVGLDEPLAASAVVRSGSSANIAAIHIAQEYQRAAGRPGRTVIGCSALAHTSVHHRAVVRKFPVNIETGEVAIERQDTQDLAALMLTLGETSTGLSEWVSDEVLAWCEQDGIPVLIDGCNAGTIHALPDYVPGFTGDNSPELNARAQRMLRAQATKCVSMEPGKTVGGSDAALIAVIHTSEDPLLQATAREILHCQRTEFFSGDGQYAASTVPANAAAMLYLFLDKYGRRRVQYDTFVAKKTAYLLKSQLKLCGIESWGGNLNWITIPYPNSDSLGRARESLATLGVAHVVKDEVVVPKDELQRFGFSGSDRIDTQGRAGLYALRVVIRPGEYVTERGFSLLLRQLVANDPRNRWSGTRAPGMPLETAAECMEEEQPCRIGVDEHRVLDPHYSESALSSGLSGESLSSGYESRYRKGLATLWVVSEATSLRPLTRMGECLEFVHGWRDKTWPERILGQRRREWLRTVHTIDQHVSARLEDGWFRRLTENERREFSETVHRLSEALTRALISLPKKDSSADGPERFAVILEEGVDLAVTVGGVLTHPGEPHCVDQLRAAVRPIPRPFTN